MDSICAPKGNFSKVIPVPINIPIHVSTQANITNIEDGNSIFMCSIRELPNIKHVHNSQISQY